MAPAGYERFIAYRYMRVRAQEIFIKLITWLSVGGVAIGVMALIVVLSVMGGFENDLRGKILGANPHVKVTAQEGDLFGAEELAKKAAAVEGVASARPYVEKKMMISTKKRARGILLRGVEPGESGLDAIDSALARASIVQSGEGEPPGILVGDELARNMGLLRGDRVRVFSPGGSATVAGFVPRFRVYRVAGTFVTGMYEYDSNWAVIDLGEARDFLRMGEGVSGVDVRLNDPSEPAVAAAQIRGLAGEKNLVRDWTQMNSSLFGAMKLEKIAMFVILGLIIVVAAFNIASTLIMVVMDKTREIGILKSMGADRNGILKIFMLKGTMIGAIGTAIGVALGLALCFLIKETNILGLPVDVFYVSTVPVEIKASTVVLIAASSVLICLLATLYPAWQASRLDPVETIRYE